jgi:hypothetical protein
MSGLFDRLDKKLDEQPREGLSPLELAKLPPSHRRLMRLLLRELELTRPEIIEASKKFPEDARMTEVELDAALAELSLDLWVVKKGEGDKALYAANLRRKAPSKLAQSIWASLHERIEQSAEEAESDT